MGQCELSSEPACASPRLFVADKTEEVLVDNAVSEGFVQCAMEPLACLDISSPAADGSEDDSTVQLHCCSDLGGGLGTSVVEDGKTTYDCPVPSDCVKDSESLIERDDLLCADGPEELVCAALGERLQELAVVPCSGSDSSLQTPTVEKDMVLISHSEEGSREMEPSSGKPDSKDENVRNLCSSTAHIDLNSGHISERRDVHLELGNAPSIECKLNKICLDERESEKEISLCCTNLTFNGQVPSEVEEVVVSPSGSVIQYMSDTIVGCGSPIGRNLVEVVCSETHSNRPLESLEMADLTKPNDCVADPQFTCAVNSFDNAGDPANNNTGTDGDMCEKCPDTCSLPLRRSSRSRKAVQQVEIGKSVTKLTKKTSKVSLHRTIDLFSEATRKKRSSLSRSICSAGWGVSENLSRYFIGSNVVAVNQVIDQRPRKKKEGQRSRKKNKVKVIASSKFPEARQEVPCRPIRLKVTFGKKEEPNKVDSMPPVAVDALPGFQPCNDSKSLNVSSYNGSSVGDCMDTSAPKEMPSLMQCSNSSHVRFTEPNLEICSVSGKSNHNGSSQLDFQKQDQSCADKFSDPGTSPDSEVIDQVLDSTIGQRVLISQHNSENKVSCGIASPKSHSLLASSKKSKNKRKKKDKVCQAGNPVLECHLSTDSVEDSKKGGQLQISNIGTCSIDNQNVNSDNLLSNSSGSEIIITELLPVADEGCHRIPCMVNGADNVYSRKESRIESTDTGNSCQLLPSAEVQVKRNSKGSKNKGKSKTKSKKIVANECKVIDTTSPQKGKRKSESKHQVRETTQTSILGEACKLSGQLETGNHDVIDVGKTVLSSNEVALENASCCDLISMEVGKQTLAPRVAWVCCDDCLKWRCIPAELADVIEETNCRWTCKDNQNIAFADCAIPQEKSNAQINAELQISDEEDARDGHLGSKSSGLRHSVASQPSTWMLIKSNLFLHRNRKDQTMDEIMVCHCKPPVNGSLGCGSQCLNRMLNIECVQGTCPCGDLCSNQQFQRRQYAMLNYFRCGKKGYGLQVLEDITEGQFLIEYVGEVLDLQSYEARQKDYALKGHKHFYFMTLNGNEVIDASAKGNLGRFVNHSCDPNCRTEKWVVNGEICVGLFSLKNIKKGEELTFDYNYVRVFGAAAKKCHCGSRKCRGYIGGDPDNADVIVQGDSDEEFPEPIVVKENGEIDHSLEDMIAKSSSLDVEQTLNGDNLSEEKSEFVVEAGEMVNSPIDDDLKTETRPEKNIVDEVHDSTNGSAGLRFNNLRNEPISIIENQTSNTEHTMSTATSSPKSDVLHVENTIQKSVSDSVDWNGRMSKVDIESELPNSRPHPRMKISRPSKSVKNRKSNDNSATAVKALVTAQRSKFVSHKPKKLLEGSANCHLEAVEEKLNELLDGDGGICKKKDASKGYLKLLLLTFAQKDSGNGGAIQSNRDLSMILDAMLKTKSRGVLLDIINKNGLQMLHNMMKLYRRDFKKIPILRKLLKVLEFLAEKEILTVERINGDPLHPGVESLRESILYFTEHDDIQVHQIARQFRNRWILHHLRKSNRMDRNDRRRDFRRGSNSHRYFGTSHHWREQGATVTERASCSDQSGTLNNLANPGMQEASSSQITDSQTIASRPRRRKSRWDQPACPRSPKKIRTSPEVETSVEGQTPAIEAREMRYYSSAKNSDDDDAPPGFSNPQDSVNNSPPGFSLSSKCPSVSLGLLQERYNPRLPVAFGIPLPVVQQFGTLQSGTVDSWAIAPAMPFQPFPPLPPNPRERRPTEEREEGDDRRDQGMPSTSGSSLSTVAVNPNMIHHERGFRNFPGKRNHRLKKWNNPKPRPPWLRNIDGWGIKGNYFQHPRNGTFDINMELVANDVNVQHLAVNHSVEYAGNSC